MKITKEVKEIFESAKKEVPKTTISYLNLLKRPEINLNFIKQFLELNYDIDILEQVEIEVKYEGYIKKAYKEAEKTRKLEEKIIPNDIDYSKVNNLASEARQKLEKIRPISIGQAARISGVNPVDISILAVYLKKEYGKNE